MELLRFATAGSVDDGKSTLIGRLLYDTKSIFEDQLEAVERTSRDRGDEHVNLALLTDGLRAEREQGITIDVAYRYFATPKRTFIIADTPGHIQYTRNMVTGASTASLALVLVDARNGIVEQSRRHAFLASLLRVPHVVLCVNKMDLVDYDEAVFNRIKDEFRNFATKLDIGDLSFIPVSALQGDNVVHRSENMPWYEGSSLLHHLEDVHIASDRNLIDVRFPVQYVIRPQSSAYPDYRGYAGMVAGGVHEARRRGRRARERPDDDDREHRHRRRPGRRGLPADVGDGPAEGQHRHLPWRHDLPAAEPAEGDQDVEAMICWLTDEPLQVRGMYAVKHTTRSVARRSATSSTGSTSTPCTVTRRADTLSLNEIGRIKLRTTKPLFVDEYRRNRTTGSFLLIDEASGSTVGAGMIL